MTKLSAEAPSDGARVNGSYLIFIMAIACGLCAGCNYINQPLLHSIAIGFKVSEAQAALSVTISQLAYACGLLLIVPLGDMLERRKLIVSLMMLTSFSLLLCALTDHIELFWVGGALAGFFSVAGQILIPLATLMVAPHQAGRAVGALVTGLLVGIQAARSISGVLSSTIGWESVYIISSALILLFALVLARKLPLRAGDLSFGNGRACESNKLGYREMMKSLVDVLLSHSRLRSRTLIGALSFSSLAVLFSTMAFMLGGEPYKFDDLTIGLISMFGVLSALVGRPVGKWVDKGRGAVITLGAGVFLPLLWLPMLQVAHSLVVFILGFMLLSAGVAVLHVCNQSVIFKLDSQARSRANALYMTGYFLGASAGSGLGIIVWKSGGWLAVCVLGFLLGVSNFLACLYDRRFD